MCRASFTGTRRSERRTRIAELAQAVFAVARAPIQRDDYQHEAQVSTSRDSRYQAYGADHGVLLCVLDTLHLDVHAAQSM